MSTLHVWLPPNYLRWGGPDIWSHLNVFLLIHRFLVGEREWDGIWLDLPRWEQNPSSSFFAAPAPSQNNNYTRALLPMKNTQQLLINARLQIGLTNICIVTLNYKLERVFSEWKCSSICLTLELKNIFEKCANCSWNIGRFGNFPTNKRLLATCSPPFPIIGLNLHRKLIIGWQGSYGLMCGLNEAIEELPSSVWPMCIILWGGKILSDEHCAHIIVIQLLLLQKYKCF